MEKAWFLKSYDTVTAGKLQILLIYFFQEREKNEIAQSIA